jgi:hypothetical protein
LTINNEKERLLCYAAGILQAKLSHPGNPYSVEGLIPSCIRDANQLIETIYDDKKLTEILKK